MHKGQPGEIFRCVSISRLYPCQQLSQPVGQQSFKFETDFKCKKLSSLIFVSSSSCHHGIMSTCHHVNHWKVLAILCNFVQLSSTFGHFHQLFGHFWQLLSCHHATMSSCLVILPSCHIVLLPYCQIAILSSCQLFILSSSRVICKFVGL